MILEQLGAKVVDNLSEQSTTHFICNNAPLRRLLAARLMNMEIVSLEWVVQCKAYHAKLASDPFIVTNDLVEAIAGIQGRSGQDISTIVEPFQRLAEAFHPKETSQHKAIGSSSFSSSNIPSSSSKSSEAVVAGKMTSSNNRVTRSAVPQSKEKSLLESAIPLPTFREYKPPEISEHSLKRRRSERLIDKDSDSEDESLNVSINTNGTKKKQRKSSGEYSGDFPIHETLPIEYTDGPVDEILKSFQRSLKDDNVPGREDFVTQATTTTMTVKKVSKSSEARKKDHSVDSKSTSSSTIRRQSSSSPPKKQSTNKSSTNQVNNINSVKTAITTTTTTSNSSSSGLKNTKKALVIALTGFDKKKGDRSSTLKTIESILERIRKSRKGSHETTTTQRFLDPFETSVKVIEDDDDFSEEFTHLVVAKDCAT